MLMSHQVLWNELNAASIRALYAKLYPSPDKVMELLQPNGDYLPLSARRERVFEFLRRYDISPKEFENFLTASG